MSRCDGGRLGCKTVGCDCLDAGTETYVSVALERCAMSKLDLTKPIRRKSDGARAVVLEVCRGGWVFICERDSEIGWGDSLYMSPEAYQDRYENVPERVVRVGPLQLTFEGDGLVAAEVLK